MPLHCSQAGGREFRSEVELGKKGGLGRRCFKVLSYFSLTYSDLIGNKLNAFPQIESVFSMTVIAERSAYPNLDP